MTESMTGKLPPCVRQALRNFGTAFNFSVDNY